MKNRKWIPLIMTLVFLLALFMLMPYSAFAGTIQYPVTISGSDIDSVQIIFWESFATPATGDTLLIDCIGGSCPIVDSLELDNTKDYYISYNYWFAGETEAWVEQIYLGFATYNSDNPGGYDITIYTIDTSGTDSPVAGVNATITNIATGDVYPKITNSGGYEVWHLDGGTYELIARDVNNIFNYDTVTFIGDSTDSILGYNISLVSVIGVNTCNVYGDIYDLDGQPAPYAEVTFSLAGNAIDTCSSVFIGRYSITKRANSSGRFQQELIYSNCLEDTDYNMTVTYKDGTTTTTTITVPRQASFQVTE